MIVRRGAFHVHSTYSYDARVALPILVSTFRQHGLHFLLLTEHDDTLDATTYARIVSECDSLSDDEFIVLPGIEIRCWRREQEQWHIAALGVREWIKRGTIREVTASIAAAGGLAILLHPHKYSSAISLEELAGFHGLEIWNAKEDGRLSPQSKTLSLGRQAARMKTIPMYCGMDLHDVDRIPDLYLEVRTAHLFSAPLLACLRNGDFRLQANGFRFSALNGPDSTQRFGLQLLRAAQFFYSGMRRVPLARRALSKIRALWK